MEWKGTILQKQTTIHHEHPQPINPRQNPARRVSQIGLTAFTSPALGMPRTLGLDPSSREEGYIGSSGGFFERIERSSPGVIVWAWSRSPIAG
jgi:hypothetical protein